MSCPRCKEINILDLLPSRWSVPGPFEWHEDIPSLRSSAKSGCGFCDVVLHELSQSLSLSTFHGLEGEKVYLTMLPNYSEENFSTVQGNSELVAYCGQDTFKPQTLDQPSEMRNVAFARFHACIERTEKERERGQRVEFSFPASLISGRPICEDPSSKECFDIARAWFKCCLSESKDLYQSHHEWCHHGPWDEKLSITPQLPSKSFTPTRTINVGTIGSEKIPFLELHHTARETESEMSSFQWATLSHCWGGSSSLTTTTTTIERHRNGIPIESMPKTFADAVRITRELGIQHLWIDSLCIIQDSDEDWVEESSKMAQVYRYSILNIAAETSRHANDGIFKPRTANRLLATFPIRKRKAGQADDKLLVFPLLDNWTISLYGEASVLSKRGWVLQENLLSPRTIHFGLQQIFWACAGTIIAEGDMNPLPTAVQGRWSVDWDWHLSKKFLTLQGELAVIQPAYASEVWYNR